MPGERHKSQRIGWLRAAVLGANDGLVSNLSLVMGVAGAAPNGRTITAITPMTHCASVG